MRCCPNPQLRPAIKIFTVYRGAQCSHHGINWAMMMRRLWWWTPALGLQKLPLPYYLFQGVQRQMGKRSLPLWITAGEWQACQTCPLHFSRPPAIELHLKYLKVVKHSTSGLELVLLIVWRKKKNSSLTANCSCRNIPSVCCINLTESFTALMAIWLPDLMIVLQINKDECPEGS